MATLSLTHVITFSIQSNKKNIIQKMKISAANNHYKSSVECWIVEISDKFVFDNCTCKRYKHFVSFSHKEMVEAFASSNQNIKKIRKNSVVTVWSTGR